MITNAPKVFVCIYSRAYLLNVLNMLSVLNVLENRKFINESQVQRELHPSHTVVCKCECTK